MLRTIDKTLFVSWPGGRGMNKLAVFYGVLGGAILIFGNRVLRLVISKTGHHRQTFVLPYVIGGLLIYTAAKMAWSPHKAYAVLTILAAVLLSNWILRDTQKGETHLKGRNTPIRRQTEPLLYWSVMLINTIVTILFFGGSVMLWNK
ncbi:MAG: hypothetical protein KCHDKBKB_01302 [Elusimicrobia bacterium]|nr:hypothetical protein [Elusimicrobiota bacterium]